MSWFLGCLMLMMVHSCLGKKIPFCGGIEAKEGNFCTNLNDSSVDFNMIPIDHHVEVKTLLRMFDFVDLDWNENTITIFLQMRIIWTDPRFDVTTK